MDKFTSVTEIETNRATISGSGNDEDFKISFMPKFLMAIFGSIYFIIVLCILLVLPVLELAFGAAYLNQCKINQNIPIYLIVTGVCGIVTILLLILITVSIICVARRPTTGTLVAFGCGVGITFIFILFMSFFLFIWFIIGSVWVFGAKKNVQYDNPLDNNYCHKTLYEFAFAMLIIGYISLLFSCCRSCFNSCRNIKKSMGDR